MLNRFRKKLTEIKTDLNHKIDQLEVDKNHILNKTQRTIRNDLTTNGQKLLNKKDKDLFDVQTLARSIEQDSHYFEKQVKEVALVHTTNLFYTIRTLEKELSSIFKTIDSTRTTIEKFQTFCIQLNNDLALLENIYSDIELEKQIEQINQSKLNDEILQLDDKIELSEESVKLTLNLE